VKTDRELLELAARAIGLSDPSGDDDIWRDAAAGHCVQWNPLEDDGDALRLAVKLRIDLEWQEDGFGIEAYRREHFSSFCAAETATMGYSIEEATRRAIVRAAAEIAQASAPAGDA
jgi:hypothetical protein